MRVFRNRPEYRFEGRLHEQIGHRLPGYLPERLEQTAVRVEHYGYLGAVRDAKEKSRRNIELLLAQQAESPPTAFLHFNLGSEYAAAGDGPAALREFERAWEMVEREGDQRRATSSCRRLSRGWSSRCGSAAGRRTRSNAPATGSRGSRTSPISCSSRRVRRWRSAARGGDRLLRTLHRAGRRAVALHRHGWLRHLPAAHRARRAASRPRRARGRRAAARLVPDEPPGLLRHDASVRAALLRRRQRCRGGRRARSSGACRADADDSLHAGHRAL